MKEFFTLEGKIEENRQRLRETLSLYKATENYYPLFFGYVALIGVYTFDIIKYFLLLTNPQVVSVIGVLLIAHVCLFSYNFYIFMKFINLKPFSHDLLPKDVYSNIFGQAIDREPRNDEENSKLSDEKYKTKIQEQTNEQYLINLEKSLEENFESYKIKKSSLTKLIKTISISFIIYVLLTTAFKLNIMGTTEKPTEKPKTEEINTTKSKESIKKPFVIPIRNTNEKKENKDASLLMESEETTNIAKFNVSKFFIETFKHLADFKFGK